MMKNVVKSRDLSRYKLTKPLQAVLDKQRLLDEYMRKGGHPIPRCVRLYPHDFIKINSAILSESEKEFDITKVLLNGRQIIKVGDPEPTFKLEPSP